MIGLLRVIPQSAGGRQLLKTPRDGPAFNLGLWVLVTIRETSGAAVGRARYLIGYAKCFKVGQERIFPAVAPRVKIHIGKRSVVRVLDTKPAWNLNHFPRRREETRGVHRSKVVCVHLHLTPRLAVHIGANSPIIHEAGRTWLHHDARPNGFIEPRIPTRAAKPPAGSDWVHEIKHDGYRLIV
jgi:hypothetical protein